MQTMALFPELFDNDETKIKKVYLKRIEARYSKECIREDAPEGFTTAKFSSPSQVFEMFSELQTEAKEHFITLHLDGKNRIVAMDRVSSGSLNQSIVHPREVFKTALLSSAAAIILVHNHPSGDPTPSQDDLDVTRRLKDAGELLGIKVLDHIIVGKTYYSFTESGHLL